MKNKNLILILILFVLILFIGGNSIAAYNKLQSLDEAINSSQAQLDNQLQRRGELVPNLIYAVKGYNKYEKSVFLSLAKSRTKIANSKKLKIKKNKKIVKNINNNDSFAPIKLESEIPKNKKIKKHKKPKKTKSKAFDKKIFNTLTNIFAFNEDYPELKADKAFLELQKELANTENRVAEAKKDYNESVKALNTAIRTFPTNIIAGFLGIQAKDYLQTEESKKELPKIKF